MTGLDRIERSTRYGIPLYKDPPADLGEPVDQFELTLGGRHYELLYDAKSTSFVTNPESHLKISHENLQEWMIVDKAGTEYHFGGLPAAGRRDHDYRFFPVSLIMDRHENRIDYDYWPDAATGAYYPETISYGTNGRVPGGGSWGTTNNSKITVEVTFCP